MKLRIMLLALFAAIVAAGCAGITDALLNMRRLQFKLDNVNNFQLAGVNLSNKTSISDFSISDALALKRAFSNRSLPAQFIINVAAKNPNDGTSGTRQSDATLSGLDWRLFIDGKETVAGGLASAVSVPGNGQTTTVPLSVNVNLYEFFANEGYDRLLNLALALSGAGGTSRISLDARPTVNTAIGPIQYPGRITIVDKEFR
ncbi:MAG TPA: hypothetical protein VEC36_14045 [Patescibacteria group bacterium]|nr:hypothetical protein [Patescibacteria group bacterium]